MKFFVFFFFSGKAKLSNEDLEEILADSDFFLSDDSDPDCFSENDEHEDLAANILESVANESDHDSDSSDDNIPLQRLKEKLMGNKQKEEWEQKTFENQYNDTADQWKANEEHEFWTPLDYFSQYFPDDFWENLSSQSNIRAMQANEKKPLKSTPEEYKKLTGIHILMGVFGLPRLRLYFMKGIEITIITQLPRDRIYKLRNFLHVVDNLGVSPETKAANKLWKVQPILDSIRKMCTTLQRPKELSIDEQMIPFTGTTSLRQYVKNKPNPVGLKNFVLATPNGLVLDFFLYQGGKTWPDGTPDKVLGIGGSVVKKLSVDIFPGTTIYFDRYFTSIHLLDYLLEKGIFGVGTIMNNRIPKAVRGKIKKDAELLREGRGTHEEWVRSDGKVSLLKWMDNRSVMMASSSAGSLPVSNVRRWDKKESKYLLVSCPNTIAKYNQSMGGVDLCDRLISYYRICMRTKKWPVRVFWHFIDLALTNSWIEYRQDRAAFGCRKSTIMDLLEFKLYVGKTLALGGKATSERLSGAPPATASNNTELSEDEATVSAPKKSKVVQLPPIDVRKTNNDHLPICSASNKNSYMRCRKPGCNKKTRFFCTKCQVYLCISPERECFFEFHTSI